MQRFEVMSKRNLRLAACAVAVVVLVGACGKVYDADEPAAAADGGADEPKRDAAEALDGALVEAGTDAAKPRFCDQAKHTLCEDFDKNSYGDSWTNIVTKGDALALDFGSSVSKPVSLLAQRSPELPDDAFLQHLVAGAFTHAVLQADVMVVSAPDVTSRLTLLDLAFVTAAGNPNWHLRFAHRATKLEIAEVHFGYEDGGYGYRFSEKAATAFPVGKWVHLTIDVDPVAQRAKVSIDGVSVFDEALAQSWQPAGVEVTVGAFAAYGESGTWKVRFDNVALDAE
ncbi:MAG: hypothetical protein KF764_15760 [Labilithrix sp.]|nr:hypothetical protein [Labilithrix sp.]